MSSSLGEHRTGPAAKRKTPKPPPKKVAKKSPRKVAKKRSRADVRAEEPKSTVKRPAKSKAVDKMELLSEESSVKESVSSSGSDLDEPEVTKRGPVAKRGPVTKRSRVGGDSDEEEAEEDSSSTGEEDAGESPPTKRKKTTKPASVDEEDGDDEEEAVVEVKKRSKITKKDVDTMVKSHAEGMGSNNTYTGMWRESGIASGPADKSDTRALQALNELSQLMINKVREGQNARNKVAKADTAAENEKRKEDGEPPIKAETEKLVQEIEAMAVNGRIMVSANESWSVEALSQINLKAAVTAQADTLTDKSPDEVNAAFSDRKEAKIALLAIGVAGKGKVTKNKRINELAAARAKAVEANPDDDDAFGGITATLRKVINDDLAILPGGSTDDAAKKVKTAAHRNQIIAVDAIMDGPGKTNKTHAEQNLILALIKSGYDGEAVIAGGKRPCMVCWITMRLARKHGFNVSFNEHPGGFWDGTTSEGVHAAATALGLSAEQLQADLDEIKDEQVDQYVTNTATKETVKVADLVDAIKKKKYNTDTLSESESQLDFGGDE